MFLQQWVNSAIMESMKVGTSMATDEIYLCESCGEVLEDNHHCSIEHELALIRAENTAYEGVPTSPSYDTRLGMGFAMLNGEWE